MKKSIVFIIATLVMVSCKTKQAAVAEQSASESKQAKEIITGHYKTPREFKTLYIKSSVSYKSKKQSVSLSAEIRVKKDEMILVSVRVLGITMAKALVTPEKVSYYEKFNNTYFEGSYAVLSKWLGSDLNYAKVQNMLTGEALDDLTKGIYQAAIENGQYKLMGKDKNTTKEFLFEGANYLLKRQTVSQGGQEPRSLDIQYPAHAEYATAVLPKSIQIEAEQKDTVNINIEYNSVKFDEALTFPYEVPEGYEQIFID
jgi:hypothetical protein